MKTLFRYSFVIFYYDGFLFFRCRRFKIDIDACLRRDTHLCACEVDDRRMVERLKALDSERLTQRETNVFDVFEECRIVRDAPHGIGDARGAL